MLKKLLFLFALGSILFAQEIRIAVAANMGDAIDAINKAFIKKYPSIHPKITLGSSGKLATQIAFGAPYGIFLSANMAYCDKLYRQKKALYPPVVYAKGALVLLSNHPFDQTKGLNVLKDSSIRRIAIANPKTAPYGKATLEVLKKLKLFKELRTKLVYAESIAQALAYIKLSTPFGIVAKSAMFSGKMKHLVETKNYLSIPTNLHSPIKQGMVLLKQSNNHASYKAFYTFMQSEEAQDILQSYGYTKE